MLPLLLPSMDDTNKMIRTLTYDNHSLSHSECEYVDLDYSSFLLEMPTASMIVGSSATLTGIVSCYSVERRRIKLLGMT